MTAEDRSRSDPDIAKKFKKLEQRQAQEVHIFPKLRIEAIALNAHTRLDSLVSSLGKEEIETPGNEEDVLMGVYLNDNFVRTKILPVVENLMRRTGQTAYLTDMEVLGYAYYRIEDFNFEIDDDQDTIIVSDKEEDDDKAGMGLVVENDMIGFKPIENAEEIQTTWDESGLEIRDDMKAFASYSKGEIIDRFYEFVQAYSNP